MERKRLECSLRFARMMAKRGYGPKKISCPGFGLVSLPKTISELEKLKKEGFRNFDTEVDGALKGKLRSSEDPWFVGATHGCVAIINGDKAKLESLNVGWRTCGQVINLPIEIIG